MRIFHWYSGDDFKTLYLINYAINFTKTYPAYVPWIIDAVVKRIFKSNEIWISYDDKYFDATSLLAVVTVVRLTFRKFKRKSVCNSSMYNFLVVLALYPSLLLLGHLHHLLLKLLIASFGMLNHVSGNNSLYLFVNLILVPVPPLPTHLFLHPSLLPLLFHHSAHP